MNDEDLHDVVDARLRAWPPASLPPALSTRVLFLARAELAKAGAGERPPSRAGSVATATAVLCAIAVYLTWAVEVLEALARG